MNATISVIVPVYGVEPYLKKCVDSILGQTYRELEVILVDDGSPDGCGRICDEYAAADSRVRVIHKPNGGLSSARNAGLDAASGDFIGFVDSDDWIEPDMYEYLLEGIIQLGAPLAVCGRFVEGADRRKYAGPPQREALETLPALEMLIDDADVKNYVWDKLYARSLFEDIRFPEGRTFEDALVMYRVFERCPRVAMLPEAGYHYFQRVTGSVSSAKGIKNHMEFWRALHDRFLDLSARIPGLKDRLLAGISVKMMFIWSAAWKNREETEGALRPFMLEMADFARSHETELLKCGFGVTGRLRLRLLKYPRPWAYFLSALLARAYSLVHRETENA